MVFGAAASRRRARPFLVALIGLGGLVGTMLGGVSATPAASVCPPQAARTITQLYSWTIRAGDATRQQLDQQQSLFDPSLYRDLQAAFDLQPSAKGFLDFDPFNGAQISSYGFRLLECRASGDQVQARVVVKAGLGPGRTTDRPILVWLRRLDGQWRIADLEYLPSAPGATSSRLKPLLRNLLNAADATSTSTAGGDVLLTPRFRIVLKRLCPEGSVTCDRVSYRGEDRRSGAAIILIGSTVHHPCADGQTPCCFLGYRFANGKVVYAVSDDGVLTVTQAGRVLLEEQGEWQR